MLGDVQINGLGRKEDKSLKALTNWIQLHAYAEVCQGGLENSNGFLPQISVALDNVTHRSFAEGYLGALENIFPSVTGQPAWFSDVEKITS